MRPHLKPLSPELTVKPSHHFADDRVLSSTSAVILMARSDIIDLKRATEMARRTPKTIRQWCRVHGIGRQSGPGARLEVSAPALEMVIHGDFEALDKLRMGERNDPIVKRYFDWLGLPSERRPAR